LSYKTHKELTQRLSRRFWRVLHRNNQTAVNIRQTNLTEQVINWSKYKCCRFRLNQIVEPSGTEKHGAPKRPLQKEDNPSDAIFEKELVGSWNKT
jgi:hypothetical protein